MAKTEGSVDALLDRRGHPLRAEIDALRAIIADATPAIGERVKWNGPSYFLVANPTLDMGSIVMARTKHVMLVLVFHNGTVIEHPLLTGDYKDRRLLQLDDMAAIRANGTAIAGIIRQWVKLHS
ncbi:MAG: DUF1801 domain-containing protein [Devosia sp.]